MFRIGLSLVVACGLLISGTAATYARGGGGRSSGSVHVGSYTRSNGKRVDSYYRLAPYTSGMGRSSLSGMPLGQSAMASAGEVTTQFVSGSTLIEEPIAEMQTVASWHAECAAIGKLYGAGNNTHGFCVINSTIVEAAL